MKGSLHMKRLFGVSLISTMLILGQPFIAFADTNVTTDATGSRTLNFEDIGSIIAEHNIDVQINENDRLKSGVGYAKLKRSIKDLENELDDNNSQWNAHPDQAITLGAERRALLDALKQAKNGVVDQPIAEALIDLQASMDDASQVRSAENKFIRYNQLKLDLADSSMNIDNLNDQLVAMQLRESLGMVSHNTLNGLETSLAGMQTKLANTNFEQDSIVRQLKNLFNDQESSLVIGSIPSTNEDFQIKDKEADLKMALENSYIIKIQEQQIVLLQTALDRAKKDHGMSSNDYKKADYDLTNANLKLAQLKDALKTDYYTMLDDISKMQSDLRLAEQNLEDAKVTFSEAQVKMGLGMISQLEMDSATSAYQAQENAVKTKQITLFNAKCSYDWFLNGMPRG